MGRMDPLTIVFTIIGGLAIFMFSVKLLSDSLSKITGPRVVSILEKATNNPVKGMGVGTATTIMTQSSSVTVLTLIGMVNAGLLTFRQSANVILGSEIGTTITAQIVSFNIGFAYYPLIAIAFFIWFLVKNEKVKLAAKVVFSLGMLFLAMDLMGLGIEPLVELPIFVDLINTYGSNPIIGTLIGALISGVTQSSSATTSLVIAFGRAEAISLEAGIAMVMGANIGTTFLELFAAIGASRPAKRTAIAQALINIIGVVVFLPILFPFAALVRLTSLDLPRQIANAHTIFNVIVSFLFVPFVGALVWTCERIIPVREGELAPRHFFDEKMLNVAQLALRESEREIISIAEKTLKMLGLSKLALVNEDTNSAKKVLRLEDEVDDFCDETENFIDKIREEDLTGELKVWRIKLLNIITDVERIGDMTNNLAEFAIKRVKDDIPFSETAKEELLKLFEKVEETYSTAIEALKQRSELLAKQAVELEDAVDVLERKFKKTHIKRIKGGVCAADADVMFTETLRNLERISDHADNIAYDILNTFYNQYATGRRRRTPT
ncbi:MAG: Na/Pi cotransporter family protein [Candidatus Hermodarchaeota archaeon]|nr:Na/Pi cotransporter family protein [Candidatus Hermodarchaeota archaeon]